MNRYYGIQDSRSSRVKYYSSDESSVGGNEEYEGDADDDSFASAQFSTGQSISHSDIPDFASVSSRHSNYSRRRSRVRNEASKLRHIESQTSLAYSIDTTIDACTSTLDMGVDWAENKYGTERKEPPSTQIRSMTKKTKYAYEKACNDSKAISPSDFDAKILQSPPKLNNLEFPHVTPFGNGGFNPIKVEGKIGDKMSPKLDHPYAMYTSPLRSSETSPTCSSHSTGLTTAVARDIPSHIRSQRVENIKQRLRSIEGNYRRNSKVSPVFRSSVSSSTSKYGSAVTLQAPDEMKKVFDAAPQPWMPSLRLAREAMCFCFLVFVVSIAYINHKESQTRSVQIQVSQMKLMEQKLLVGMESEANSVQLEIEKYKLLSQTLAQSKQLIPISTSDVASKTSIVYRYYQDPFEAAQCELDSYEYSHIIPMEKSITRSHPSAEPSTQYECCEDEDYPHNQIGRIVDYSCIPNPIQMMTPTPTPTFTANDDDNLISQRSSHAITKKRTTKRFPIPMHDFYLVQTMLD